jgi:hypothetical protein
MARLYENAEMRDSWYTRGAEELLIEAMNRGSTDNISVMLVGLNDPSATREPKKGNEHIKILSALNSSTHKKRNINNKENSMPEKMKELDSKILEINRSASKILQPRKY